MADPRNAHAPTMRGAAVGFGESRHPQRTSTPDRLRLPATRDAGLRHPPYGKEVLAELQRGREPNVRLFCGRDAWQKAERWRKGFGPGSALVLPRAEDPSAFRWPRMYGVIVDYPEDSPAALERKQALASALIRDGVEFVLMKHEGKPIIARAAQGGA